MNLEDIALPARVWSRDEVLLKPSCVPASPGVYGWWFDEAPPGVPTGGCVQRNGLTLLYVGISPKKPPTNGRPASSQTLRSRIQYHYRGNAEGSTLRRTLGCLLADSVGLALRRVGSGKRYTFTAQGEATLSRWMGEHAFVSWAEHLEPWHLEEALISGLDVPLNLDQNSRNPYHATLAACRASALASARALPVLPR